MVLSREKPMSVDVPARLDIPDSVRDEVEQLAMLPGKKSSSLAKWLDEAASQMKLIVWSRLAYDSKHLISTFTPLLMEAVHGISNTRFFIPVVVLVTSSDTDHQTVELPRVSRGLSQGAYAVNWHQLSSITCEQDLTVLSPGVGNIQTGRSQWLVLEVISNGVPTWNPETWFQELEKEVFARKGRLVAVVSNPEWWVTALLQSLPFCGSAEQQTSWTTFASLSQPGMQGFSLSMLDTIARYSPTSHLERAEISARLA